MDDHARIYEEWHRYAKNRDTEGLLSLYAEDAVLKAPRASNNSRSWRRRFAGTRSD